MGLVVAAALPITAAAAEIAGPGDHRATHILAATGEAMPYRLYVPAGWNPAKHSPLVVLLHGGGLDENAPFDREPPELKGEVFRLADAHGFILLAPYGYDRNGGYGHVMTFPPGTGPVEPNPKSPEEKARIAALSEADVLSLTDAVAKTYAVDPARIFLMGNSMGGIGTMYLAIHHPNRWRAITASEGGLDARFAADFDKIRANGVLLVKKDDTPEKTAAAQATATKLTALGVKSDLIVVPDSRHETAWYIALPKIFDFFDTFAK